MVVLLRRFRKVAGGGRLGRLVETLYIMDVLHIRLDALTPGLHIVGFEVLFGHRLFELSVQPLFNGLQQQFARGFRLPSTRAISPAGTISSPFVAVSR